MKPIFIIKIPDALMNDHLTRNLNKTFEKIEADYHVIFLVSMSIKDIDFQVFNGTKLSLQKQIQLLDMFKDCKIYEPAEVNESIDLKLKTMEKKFEYNCGKCGKQITFAKKVLKLYTKDSNRLCIDCYNELAELVYNLWDDQQIAKGNLFGR